MYQLKYDKGFNKITRDINYIKNVNDIPSKIREYITNTSNNRIIYDKASADSFIRAYFLYITEKFELSLHGT